MSGWRILPGVERGAWRRCENLRKAACLAALSGLTIAGLAAQAAPPWTSVWAGVYTEAQAGRGQQAYDSYCANCHGRDLGGNGNVRALVGPRFYRDWGEDTLNSLFTITRSTMPRGGEMLSNVMYLDIVAYVLKANGYPVGSAELTADTVERVRVVGKDGPAPVPNFALVAAVGCLARSATGVWSIEHSTEPVRTRNPDPSPEAERRALAATAAGPGRFELMDVYSSGNGHVGHLMEVKGLLIRGTGGTPDRINITGIQMLAPDCPR